MENMDFLSGILNFATYFGLSVVFLIVFKVVYAKVTPHDEWALIKGEQNVAASIALGGAVLGFAIAVSGVVNNSVSLIDFAMWAVVALVAQLFAFAIVRFIFMPKIVSRIENGEVSAGVIVACVSVAIGTMNAACMSY